MFRGTLYTCWSRRQFSHFFLLVALLTMQELTLQWGRAFMDLTAMLVRRRVKTSSISLCEMVACAVVEIATALHPRTPWWRTISVGKHVQAKPI
jgi:hypothetical protein